MDYKELNILIFGLITATIIGVITSIIGTISLEILREHDISAIWLIIGFFFFLWIFWKKFAKRRLEFPSPKEFKYITEANMLEFAEKILSIGRSQRFFSIWTSYTFDINPTQDLKKLESIKFDFIKVTPAAIAGALIYFVPTKIFGLVQPSVFYTIDVILSIAVAVMVFLQMVKIIHNKFYLTKAYSLSMKARLDINSGILYDPDVLYLVFDFDSNEIITYYNKKKRKEEALQLIEDVEEQCLRDSTE